MEEHLRYTPQDRAEVVHCRCGSRLPWKACHNTGIGQPPHYLEFQPYGIVYRVSPLALCPCDNTEKTHYQCCWKDTFAPRYLIDTNAKYMFRQARHTPSGRLRDFQKLRGQSDFEMTMLAEAADFDKESELLIETVRKTPELMRLAFAEEGLKSQLVTWDMGVYAGCMERLERPFIWRDLHWKLDKSELLAQTKRWNKALQQYCDDMGLQGDERDRVVAKHRANPCAPCGRVGCDAFEKEVREFQRCSKCKSISYCGRACEKKDWAVHRKCCIG
jgi:MYND finger